MILHKFYLQFVKFPSCYYVIDFFKVITDFTTCICSYQRIFFRNIFHFTPVSFVSGFGRICPEVLEKKILEYVNAFLLFCNYLLFEKGLDLHTRGPQALTVT